MEKILKTEITRLTGIIKKTGNHTELDAYIRELNNIDNLSYKEIKYFLEQMKNYFMIQKEQWLWEDEIKAINNTIELFNTIIENKKETEPLNLFWRSFKLWTQQDLPNLGIIKKSYLGVDNFDRGGFYLDIDFASSFTKYCGLEYEDRFSENCITLTDLKIYIEMFYNLFVEDRYEYTKHVNKHLQKFRLPYKLKSGKLLANNYKSTNENAIIIDVNMLENKILWSEDRILGGELLDKHTALNYITDGLEFLLSLIKLKNNDKKSIEQKAALLFSIDENSKVYSVIKTEVEEIQKIVNEYFDIRHNEYINKAKENRESLKNPLIIEYLYNRIYCLLTLLKYGYSKKYSLDIENEELPC